MPRLLRAAVWIVLALALAAALQQLAAWQLRGQLLREAAAFLQPLAHGDTPYRWPLQGRSDLVGGRVFGDCDYTIDAQGLLLRQGSRLCEIGLPLDTALDLRRFDRLAIDADAALPPFWLQLREWLQRPQHVVRLDLTDATARALTQLRWQYDQGGAAPAPLRAAMLRLRLAKLDADLRLRSVALLPADAGSTAQWLPPQTADQPLPHKRLPLFAFDTLPRPERLLQQRAQLREREPAAQFLLREDLPALNAALAAAPAPSQRLLPWLLPLLAAAMLISLKRPRGARALRAALQAGLALALPLGLVLGLQIGDDLDLPVQVGLILALLYSAALARCDTATAWHWNGPARAWLAAAGAPLLALTLLLVCAGAKLPPLDPARLSFYLLWALLQQYLICAVLADRLRVAGLAPRWTILAAATVFALLHAPNAALMLATFAGGLLWTTLWLRDRCLLPLAASHAAAATLLGGLPVELLRSAEVSLRYYL